MAKIPEYQPRVSPSALGAYRGPTQAQIAAQYDPNKNQVAVAAINAIGQSVAGFTQAMVDRQLKIQNAFDNAQEAKAEAQYFAGMNKRVAEISTSGLSPEKYLEEFEKAEREVYEEASKLFEGTSEGFLFGGKNQATTKDRFDAFRMSKGSEFQAATFNASRSKMLDIATAQMNEDLELVRANPDTYLDITIGHIGAYLRDDVISSDLAWKMRSQATKIATISTYYNQALALYDSQGEEAVILWMTDNRNTPDLKDDERAQLMQDVQRKMNGLSTVANENKKKELNASDIKAATMFFDGELRTDEAGKKYKHYLTRQDVLNDPGFKPAKNAEEQNIIAEQKRQHWLAMIETRDSKGGGEEHSDPIVLSRLFRDLGDPMLSEGRAVSLVDAAVRTGKISNADMKQAYGMAREKRKSATLKDVADQITNAASPNGIPYSLGEAQNFVIQLNKTYYDRQKMFIDTGGKVPEMTDKEVADIADGFTAWMVERSLGKRKDDPRREWAKDISNIKKMQKGENWDAIRSWIEMATERMLEPNMHLPGFEQPQKIYEKWMREGPAGWDNWAKNPSGKTVQPDFEETWTNGFRVFGIQGRDSKGNKIDGSWTFYTKVLSDRNPNEVVWAIIDPVPREDGSYSINRIPMTQTFIDTQPEMVKQRNDLRLKAAEEAAEKLRLNNAERAKRAAQIQLQQAEYEEQVLGFVPYEETR